MTGRSSPSTRRRLVSRVWECLNSAMRWLGGGKGVISDLDMRLHEAPLHVAKNLASRMDATHTLDEPCVHLHEARLGRTREGMTSQPARFLLSCRVQSDRRHEALSHLEAGARWATVRARRRRTARCHACPDSRARDTSMRRAECLGSCLSSCLPIGLRVPSIVAMA